MLGTGEMETPTTLLFSNVADDDYKIHLFLSDKERKFSHSELMRKSEMHIYASLY